MDDAPPSDPLGERIAKIEGIVEAEDRLLERGLEGSNKVQAFIIGVVGLLTAAAVALFRLCAATARCDQHGAQVGVHTLKNVATMRLTAAGRAGLSG